MTSRHLTIEKYHHIVLVTIRHHRLTEAADIAEIGDDLLGVLDRNPKISLVIDLSAVQAMSSQMLAKLVQVHKGVARDKGRLCLAGVGKTLMPLFKTTKLHKVFTFKDDPQKILLEWQRKPL